MKLASFYPRMRIHFVIPFSLCSQCSNYAWAPVNHPGNALLNYSCQSVFTPSDTTTSFLISALSRWSAAACTAHSCPSCEVRYPQNTPYPTGWFRATGGVGGGITQRGAALAQPPAPAGWRPKCGCARGGHPRAGTPSTGVTVGRHQWLPVPPTVSGAERPVFLIISVTPYLKQSGWASKKLFSITVLGAAVLKGSYFYFETRSCFLKSRKVIYLISNPTFLGTGH